MKMRQIRSKRAKRTGGGKWQRHFLAMARLLSSYRPAVVFWEMDLSTHSPGSAMQQLGRLKRVPPQTETKPD